MIFKHKKYLLWPSMTFEVILYFMKILRLHNVSIHRNFYQNRFINKYARKKKAKISESRSHGARNHGVPESRSFLVKYRRTYVLKNYEVWLQRSLKVIKCHFYVNFNLNLRSYEQVLSLFSFCLLNFERQFENFSL